MIVAAGPPEEVVKVEGSYTGRYLKPIIERDKNRMKKRLQEKKLSDRKEKAADVTSAAFQWPNDPRQALFKKIFIALYSIAVIT